MVEFNATYISHLVHAGQVQGQASLSRTPGAPNAVHMHFRVWGDVHIDHRFELFDVQATRGHIGGHQDGAAAVGELRDHLVAVALFQITMQSQGHKAFGLQQVQ